VLDLLRGNRFLSKRTLYMLIRIESSVNHEWTRAIRFSRNCFFIALDS
jgi:hypothetical protein